MQNFRSDIGPFEVSLAMVVAVVELVEAEVVDLVDTDDDDVEVVVLVVVVEELTVVVCAGERVAQS